MHGEDETTVPRGPYRSERRAGIAVPLFSLRTASSPGVGEIPDLIPLATWAARMGQSIVQLLPINETRPGEASPYAALSAFALDPLYLNLDRVEDVRAAGGAPRLCLGSEIAAGQALPRTPIREAKLSVLAAAWTDFRKRHLLPGSARGRSFSEFVESESSWLHDYALFRALKERHGWCSWEEWPEPVRDRDGEALRRLSRDLADRTGFFSYVQWLLFEQWNEVLACVHDRGVRVKGDLPFVVGRDSVDAWAQPALFVPGWEIGAPADDFSASGQKWGLPLYDWLRARETGFAWWRARVRQAARLYDLFRIDHIVGFFRTYAFPTVAKESPRFHPHAEPEQIAQGEAFLRMLREESGSAVPIVEDLGTIPPFVRKAIREHALHGYAVMRWERRDGEFLHPRRYPALSVATTGTHDTSTLAEWWEEISPGERRSLASGLGLTVPGAALDEPCLAAPLRHAILQVIFEAASNLVILPVQDLFGWRERINLPMTESSRNWNYRLPFALGPQGEVPSRVEREGAVIRELVARAGRSLPQSAGP